MAGGSMAGKHFKNHLCSHCWGTDWLRCLSVSWSTCPL